jgi:hypothetical protein
MAAMPDRLSGAILFKAPEPFSRQGFADLMAPHRRASAHPAMIGKDAIRQNQPFRTPLNSTL